MNPKGIVNGAANQALHICIEAAVEARLHSVELTLASRAAIRNAEALETIVCKGTPQQIEDAADAVRVTKYLDPSMPRGLA